MHRAELTVFILSHMETALLWKNSLKLPFQARGQILTRVFNHQYVPMAQDKALDEDPYIITLE